MSNQSRHSVLAVRTNLSAKAFARGDRTGVLITWAPIDLITSSNDPRELGVPVADQEVDRSALVLQGGGQVTRLLGDPGPDRVGRHAGQEHLPTLEVDEEQHIEPAQRDRVHVKEVAS
jgi:hypothetical protein